MNPNTYLSERERAKLESVRVGVAGAGGLGSNCAMHLVRAGVVHLVVADFDVVSESNLNRQFFFRDQVGRPKVEALAENLRRINPDVDIELHDERIGKGNFASVFGTCDILVEAFDAAEAKLMFLTEAPKLGRPMVVASGIAGWGRSAAIVQRRMGGRLVVIGDGESDVGAGIAPVSPRVGIAAAMEANAVCALALGLEI